MKTFTLSFSLETAASAQVLSDALFFFVGHTSLPTYSAIISSNPNFVPSGYNIVFQIYTASDGRLTAQPGIYLVRNNAVLQYSSNVSWFNSTTTALMPSSIRIAYARGITSTWVVSVNGKNVITYSDNNNPNWITNITSTSYWGVCAWNGGGSENVTISNVQLTTTPVPFYPVESTSLLCDPALSCYYRFDIGDATNTLLSNYASGKAVFDATLSSTGLLSTASYMVGYSSLFLTATSSQYVTLPSYTILPISAINNGMTFSCWFKSNGSAKYSRLFDMARADAHVLAYMDTTSLTLYMYTNSAVTYQTYTNASINNNTTWYHMVWVLTSTAWVLYINGVAVNTTGAASSYYPATGNYPTFYIGKSNNSSDPYYNGYIDDFRVYNRALSATEAMSIYGYIKTQLVTSMTSNGTISGNAATQVTPTFTALATGGSGIYTYSWSYSGGNVSSMSANTSTSASTYFTAITSSAMTSTTTLICTITDTITGYIGVATGTVTWVQWNYPFTVPGISLWLDGADPYGNSTLPTNGAILSTWTDKSNNGRHATGVGSPVITTSAVNGLSCANMNGGNWFTSSIASGTFSSYLNVFFVYKVNGSVSFYAPWTRSSGATGAPFEQYSENRYIGGTWFTSTWNHASATSTTLMTQMQNVSGRTFYEYLNGSTSAAASSTASGSDTASTFYIGTRGDTVTRFNGYMCEIIVVNASVSLSVQQKIEGYLAWKWGVRTSLPTSHPYYSTAP
jgi:hypothetical protein